MNTFSCLNSIGVGSLKKRRGKSLLWKMDNYFLEKELSVGYHRKKRERKNRS